MRWLGRDRRKTNGTIFDRAEYIKSTGGIHRLRKGETISSFAEGRIAQWRKTQNYELVNGMAEKFASWDSILRQVDKNINRIAEMLGMQTVEVLTLKPICGKPKKKSRNVKKRKR